MLTQPVTQAVLLAERRKSHQHSTTSCSSRVAASHVQHRPVGSVQQYTLRGALQRNSQRGYARRGRQLHLQVVQVAAAPAETAFQELAKGTGRKYIMISGKGGVGKTSLSASLAAKLAAEGHATLVVSTDPAHSLSDSLAQDLKGGEPVLLEGTDLPLWGMEIDPVKAKEEFKVYAGGKGKEEAKEFAGGFGLGGILEQLTDLRLGELLDTPPPGFDEAVAISKVVQFVNDERYARFTRIIFDTAPTGHTLRFLAVPDFVDTSLEKIIKLRQKLSGASGAIRSLFGQGEQQDEAVEKLKKLQSSIRMVRDLFRDKESTEFIVATIPTVLGINESSRLAKALKEDGVPCKRIIVNQVIGESMGDAWVKLKLKDQQAALQMLETEPSLKALQHVKAPYLDLEVRGVPGLQYFGSMIWGEIIDKYAAGQGRKYFMLGGKGGVGKTSSAAALGVQLAAQGHETLVVSTDPAHSLSDALDQDVSGGYPVQLQGTVLPLWGMEIDIDAAKQEIRDISSKDDGKQMTDFLSSVGMGGFADQLRDLQLGDLLDTPPPGVDEAVAISKVVAFLRAEEYSKFTRIVFDTAPTGHTLRLLTLPDFLDSSIGKIVRLRQKIIDAANAVKGVFGVKSEKDPAVEKLEALKARMEEAKELFRNQDTTEFVIVAIPTVMAMAESARLATALKQEHVPNHVLLINQVVSDSATGAFLTTRRKDQQRALQRLREDPNLKSLEIIEAPLIDLEVRGIPALTYFGSKVWQ